MFQASQYQQQIFQWVQSGQGHAIVAATAGAGKTTTAVKCAALLEGQQTLFLAFNKHAAEQLKDRLPTGCASSTIHSLGNMALRRALPGGKPNIKGDKLKAVAQPFVDKLLIQDADTYQCVHEGVVKLADFCRLTLTDPAAREAVRAMIERYGIELDVECEDTVLDLLPAVLAESEKQARELGLIDFTDMIYLPTKWKLRPRGYDFVIVDEAQDLNAAQLEVVLSAVKRGGRVMAIGDRNQAIYGWAGADHHSMDVIKERLGAVELPLSVTYRCPVSHVRLAQTVTKDILPAPGAPEGVVRDVKREELHKHVAPGDLILCRVTAPLIATCYELIAEGVNAAVRGRDIAAGLIRLIEKIMGKRADMEVFPARLTAYRDKQTASLRRRYDGDVDKVARALEDLDDKLEVLRIVESKATPSTTAQFIAALNGIFDDSRPAVTLSTVHRAKGLEADRVAILRGELLPHPRAATPQEMEGERCVKFVALTRAKKELLWVLDRGQAPAEPEQPVLVEAPETAQALALDERAQLAALGWTVTYSQAEAGMWRVTVAHAAGEQCGAVHITEAQALAALLSRLPVPATT
ncbi:ATP-dependent DNA helicase Rep [Deinococcus carri]|uniref:DNA 3'-5' helicase n=1 Tax=Deinococcus carri TaxID=1211323 RepID=A0ABP9WBT9_9DEIO